MCSSQTLGCQERAVRKAWSRICVTGGSRLEGGNGSASAMSVGCLHIKPGFAAGEVELAGEKCPAIEQWAMTPPTWGNLLENVAVRGGRIPTLFTHPRSCGRICLLPLTELPLLIRQLFLQPQLHVPTSQQWHHVGVSCIFPASFILKANNNAQQHNSRQRNRPTMQSRPSSSPPIPRTGYWSRHGTRTCTSTKSSTAQMKLSL
jgi:hypothetical protein